MHHTDAVVGDRRDVGLDAAEPSTPRRKSDHGATCTCLRMPHRRGPWLGCSRPSERRMGECRPSAAAQYRARSPFHPHRVRVLLDVRRRPRGRTARPPSSRRRAVHRATRSFARLARLPHVNGASTCRAAVEVANPIDGLAFRIDTETCEVSERVRHQTFAAGLVDRPRSPFDDGHVQPGPGPADRGGQSGWAAAGDEQVDHLRLASAVFSTPILVRSRTALQHGEHQLRSPMRCAPTATRHPRRPRPRSWGAGSTDTGHRPPAGHPGSR